MILLLCCIIYHVPTVFLQIDLFRTVFPSFHNYSLSLQQPLLIRPVGCKATLSVDDTMTRQME